LQETSEAVATPSWESWDCPRCGRHNTFRAYCPSCRTALSAVAPTAAPAAGGSVAPPIPVTVPVGHPAASQRLGGRPHIPWPWAAIGAGLVAAAAGAFMLLRDPGPSYPKSWDPRVAALAEFVEAERDLQFEHPVHVDFMTAAEYREEVTTDSDSASLTDDEKQELARVEGMFRAIGLLSGEVDLLASFNQLQDEGTVAFYDPHGKRVRVRGTELTPALRKTLVHELTHAVQDQHFDLTRLGGLETDAANNAFRTVVEGDAMRIEARYEDSLSEAERSTLETEKDTERDETDFDGIPPVFVAYMGAPYALGQQLVALLEETGGTRAINDALRVPPSSEENLLDPYTHLAGERPRRIAGPELPDGAEQIDDGDFGALTLYFVLATRLDAREALRAVDGWAGDSYVAYSVGAAPRDRVCVRAQFATDTDSDRQELQGALTRWGGTVAKQGNLVTFEACEPARAAGEPAAEVPEMSPAVLALPVARAEVTREGEKAGMPRRTAKCFAGRVITSLTLEQITNPGPVLADPGYQAQLRNFALECATAG
jgi:hypothetical protein